MKSGLKRVLVWCAAAACSASLCAAERFESAALVDSYDFAFTRDKSGKILFDTETLEGNLGVLSHVLETGATTILWRNCGGSTMRYPSQIETHHHSSRLDKRRVADGREIAGWVRYGEAEVDIIATVVKMCKERGLKPGIHWPFEETHWALWTVGRYNFEHPQYWGRDAAGRPWWGRVSLAYEPVIEHKLALVDELVDRGIEVLFIDFWRTGGWSPAYEYVDPIVEAYRSRYGEDPPSDARDPRWCRHVAGYVTEFLRKLRRHLQASGRSIELAVGLPEIAPGGDEPLARCAADWRSWVEEGLIDTLVINYVTWDKEAPLESTRAAYREVLDAVDGRCRVWCPVQQYNYSRFGLPAYEQATGKSNAELAEALARIAHEEGAGGISLECVDYNNYRSATREALRKLAKGECRFVEKRRR